MHAVLSPLAEQRHKQPNNFHRAWTQPQQLTEIVHFDTPAMDAICTSCHAIMFPWEMSQKKKTFSACCRHGTIQLQPFKDPSPALQGLFDRTTPQSQQFMANIRHYNGLVSMASRSVSGKMVEFNGRGPQPFKMSGQMYHLTPSAVFPDTTKKPKFSQIYVFDQDNEIKNRLHHAKGNDLIQVPTLTLIQNELKAVNPLVKFFKTGADIFTANPNHDLKMVFKSKSSQGAKKRHLNPNVPDVVIFAPGQQTEPRDILLYRTPAHAPNHNQTTRIHELHPMYDPAAYPLILPHGDAGFSLDNPIYKVNAPSTRTKVSLQEFTRFHLQQRTNSFNTLLKSGKLAQEYFCDQYSKIEGRRMHYYKTSAIQDKYRAFQYSGLIDTLATQQTQPGQTEVTRIGQKIILPASHTGSPRYLYKHYLDALAIAARYRKFDLFTTITANPRSEGVLSNIFAGQQPSDRPDIVNKIFKQSLDALLTDMSKGIFGKMKARIHTVEGQMRGLKHAHILLLLQEILTVDDIDKIIRADIPDPQKEPELHQLVCQFMLHGPCGPANPKSPCMVDGICSKKFPKHFCANTRLPHDGHGYPEYRRPIDGHTFEKNHFLFDSRWVVPYNAWILLKYKSHINVEFVGSFHTIKYLYKYLHKGVDVGTLEIEDKDEISRFINARTIDAHEAHWRIMEYKIQDRIPAVTNLAIHTAGQQSIIFREGHAQEALAAAKPTTLLAFFQLNSQDPDARQYLYMQIPEHYTWKDHTWTKKHSSPNASDIPSTIGRMSNVSVRQEERFYLKLLLAHIRGPQSYEDLKVTVLMFFIFLYAKLFLHFIV